MEAASLQKVEAGDVFLVWGLISGTMNLLSQLVAAGHLPQSALWASVGLLVVGAFYTAGRAGYYRARSGTMSLLQREFLNVLWLALGLAFITDAIGFNIFAQWAQAAIWTVMGAFVLLYIGMHGNRRGLIGGILLIASVAGANFTPQYAGYVLAGGMYLGWAGFGLAETVARA